MVDLGVYVSSFQPLTNGDLQIIQELGQHCNNMLVLISSSDRPLSVRAPFSLEERIAMVRSLEWSGNVGITIEDIGDWPGHDDLWTGELLSIVENVLGNIGKPSGSVAVASYVFDSPIYDLVPDAWTRPCIEAAKRAFRDEPSRDSVLAGILSGQTDYKIHCPRGVASIISDWFSAEDTSSELIGDAEAIEMLQAKYGNGPFYAVDVVVKKGSKVLTIRRGGRPCRGAIAFPGGLIDPGETPLAAAQRELGEETDIGKVLFDLPVGAPVPFEPTKIVERKEPLRDPRYTHMETTAFLWELPDDGVLPVISGHDDAQAEEAGKPRSTDWRDISALTPDVMWADSGYFLRDLIHP